MPHVRSTLVALLLALCYCGVISAQIDTSLNDEWELYKINFNKTYSQDHEERTRRLIWEENIRYIKKHNLDADLGKHTFWLGENHLTDMTLKEVIGIMTGKMDGKSTPGSTYLTPSNVVVPDTVDWRTKGYVTPVKDQGQCGSCWAFSAIASLEGQQYRKSKKLVSLSEQNLVDCSRKYGNEGCGGGFVEKAFDYIKDNSGIDTEKAYPYTAKDGFVCKYKSAGMGASIKGYTSIREGDEGALQSAVASVGPVSACIDVTDSFMHYSRGVYNEPACSSTRTNHCILVTGYGSMENTQFWMIKNSWGTRWGMSGYIMMSRNRNNQCGIATDALYPNV